MSRAKIVTDDAGRYCGIRIKCPGCGGHVVATDWTPAGMEQAHPELAHPRWTFNGDLERPTLSPSLLTRTGHYLHSPAVPGNCACDFEERCPGHGPWTWPCVICHSFVTDGRIQFLGDCTHALAGQTVDLPEIEGESA